MLNRTLALIVLCVSSMLPPSAHANDRDGRWWSQLSQGEKLVYVSGFFDGTIYFAAILTGTSLKAMTDPKTGKFSSTRAEVARAASQGAMQTVQENLSNLTAGQLVDGLDETYSDFRNQGISVSDCIYVVIYAIKGGSEAEVTRLLEVRRKLAGK